MYTWTIRDDVISESWNSLSSWNNVYRSSQQTLFLLVFIGVAITVIGTSKYINLKEWMYYFGGILHQLNREMIQKVKRNLCVIFNIHFVHCLETTFARLSITRKSVHCCLIIMLKFLKSLCFGCIQCRDCIVMQNTLILCCTNQKYRVLFQNNFTQNSFFITTLSKSWTMVATVGESSWNTSVDFNWAYSANQSLFIVLPSFWA